MTQILENVIEKTHIDNLNIEIFYRKIGGKIKRKENDCSGEWIIEK